MDRKESEYIVQTSFTKKFGDFTAVDKLQLKIKEGEIYGLLGPNGAGKTTAIKILCGLTKPTSGEAYVFGSKIPNDKYLSHIGYMPQETALSIDLTVHQNIELFGGIFEMPREKIIEKEEELLKFIDMGKWKDVLISKLSGGMKHRVSLACAMVHEPKLLILDEPTVGVDPELRASFWEYFRGLRDKHVTIIMTTHYMDEAQHCDRIGLIRQGQLIAEGTPGEITEKTGTKSLEDAFLIIARKGLKS